MKETALGWGMRRLHLTTPGKELDGKERCKKPRKNPTRKPARNQQNCQKSRKRPWTSQLVPNSFPTLSELFPNCPGKELGKSL